MNEKIESINIKEADRLVPPSFRTDPDKAHVKALTERARGYPPRIKAPEGMPWKWLKENGYKPKDYTAQVVFDNDKTKDPNNPKLWADPVNPKEVDHPFDSFEGIIKIDKNGRPLNPKGPTGLEGRGLLGKWGANYAADPIVTRINKSGELEMIVIKRDDTGEWAIPGGMVDKGERIGATLKRELGEETSADLDFANADKVYEGYVDDPRNTDNSWMETSAYHLHLPEGGQVELKAGSDALEVKWTVISKELLDSLYASHGNTVRLAVSLWQDKTHKVVDKTGYVRS